MLVGRYTSDLYVELLSVQGVFNARKNLDSSAFYIARPFQTSRAGLANHISTPKV